MIRFRSRGDFKQTERFLKKSLGRNYRAILEKYGQKGVLALTAATPIDTGLTAASWDYDVIQNEDGFSITWFNTNVKKGYCNIAVILQYGHGTRNGGWVEGRDYINPALQSVFDELANAAWKEVTSV